MKKLSIGTVMFAAIFGVAEAQPASPPPLIPFGGTMTSSTGAPVVGRVSAIFALYEEQVGGVPLWVDIQSVQTDANGDYMALLGGASALPVELFASGQALWLGVQPEADVELPRIPFTSVPYALQALNAETLGGRSLSEFMLVEDGDPERSTSVGTSDRSDSADDDPVSDSMHAGGGWVDDGAVVRLATATDKVGVGTTTPGTFLHGVPGLAVYGATTSGISLANDGTSDKDWLLWSFNDDLRFFESGPGHVGGNDRMALRAGGNVGIGTVNPVERLVVSRATSAATSMMIQNSTTGGTVNDGFFVGIDSLTNGLMFNFEPTADMIMGAGGVSRIWVKPDGKVGIGTGVPTARLHVAGDIKVDGNIAAKYQDVAEWVPAVGAPPAGTVVVADPEGRNRVMASESEYDTRVLGAVSAQPGLVLGERSPGDVLVAQSGRVLVKADATFGPIAVGDILTTSATPGHARRSDPVRLEDFTLHRPGTVLGKALEPLSEGRGEILVLITLQ